MRTEAGVSVVVSAAAVLLSLAVFTLVYALLLVANVFLLAKFARRGPTQEESPSLAMAHGEEA